MMRPMSDYAKQKDMERGYRHYLKTVSSIPDFITRKLAKMPGNKGYIWRGVHCYGRLPCERGEPLVMFEKHGDTLVIHETTETMYRVFEKFGKDRKNLVYEAVRRQKAGAPANIMDYCGDGPSSPPEEDTWKKQGSGKQGGKVAAGKVAAGKVAAGKVVAGKVVAGKVVAGKVVAGKVVERKAMGEVVEKGNGKCESKEPPVSSTGKPKDPWTRRVQDRLRHRLSKEYGHLDRIQLRSSFTHLIGCPVRSTVTFAESRRNASSGAGSPGSIHRC